MGEAIPIMNEADGFREGLNPPYDLSLPDRQISESCPAPFAKIFRFAFYPNQIYIPRRPVPQSNCAEVDR
jgi:hypothetical protein